MKHPHVLSQEESYESDEDVLEIKCTEVSHHGITSKKIQLPIYKTIQKYAARYSVGGRPAAFRRLRRSHTPTAVAAANTYRNIRHLN